MRGADTLGSPLSSVLTRSFIHHGRPFTTRAPRRLRALLLVAQLGRHCPCGPAPHWSALRLAGASAHPLWRRYF